MLRNKAIVIITLFVLVDGVFIFMLPWKPKQGEKINY